MRINILKKLIFLSVILLSLIGACGVDSSSDSDQTSLEKISNESGIYTIEDFINTGFKVNKEYDVSELE
ncbi:MAG: hypothetical protein CL905_01275, partial [Dehalococcoidia bacterium]|nr:hypothetical protein [Dehalococcoidia bacterium]